MTWLRGQEEVGRVFPSPVVGVDQYELAPDLFVFSASRFVPAGDRSLPAETGRDRHHIRSQISMISPTSMRN